MNQSDELQDKIIKWIKEQSREEISIPCEKVYKEKKKYTRKTKYVNKSREDEYQ